MIKRTYEQCLLSGHPKKNIVVATDSNKIASFCKKNFLNYKIIKSKCLTGTDRVLAISSLIKYKFYINIQGDEPIFNPSDIKKMVVSANKYPDKILNGYTEIKNKNLFFNKNIPKVVFSQEKELLYMSRQPIPSNAFLKNKKAYRQVCIYVYPIKLLNKFRKNKKTEFEFFEDIEILRFLELGIPVKMIKLSDRSIAVDIPSDVSKVEKFLNNNKNKH